MQRTVAQSFQEYARGVAGGLMFSLPLLYTMEMWWAGFIAHPLRLLVYVLVTFGLLLGYNRYVGLRRDASMTEVVIDSVEELGIGFILAALVLLLLGRIAFAMELSEVVGKIVVEAMTVAIGVSVGTAQLGGGEEEDEGMDAESSDNRSTGDDESGGKEKKGDATGKQGQSGTAAAESHFGGQLVIAVCGAVLFAANVAPTEEIVMIAAEAGLWNLFGLVLFSLALGALILYYSEFTGAKDIVSMEGRVAVIAGTVITYAIALISSAMILWFFGRFEGLTPATCLAQTIVLGVAATLGASAGRLLLQ